MQDIWRANGPPTYMSLAAYVGWKPSGPSAKSDDGEYGDLAELEAMFGDTGGVIQ